MRARAYDQRDREGTLSKWSNPVAWNDSKSECAAYFDPQDNRLSGDTTAAATLVVYGGDANSYDIFGVDPVLGREKQPFQRQADHYLLLPATHRINVVTFYPDIPPHQVNKSFHFLINPDNTLTIISW